MIQRYSEKVIAPKKVETVSGVVEVRDKICSISFSDYCIIVSSSIEFTGKIELIMNSLILATENITNAVVLKVFKPLLGVEQETILFPPTVDKSSLEQGEGNITGSDLIPTIKITNDGAADVNFKVHFMKHAHGDFN